MRGSSKGRIKKSTDVEGSRTQTGCSQEVRRTWRTRKAESRILFRDDDRNRTGHCDWRWDYRLGVRLPAAGVRREGAAARGELRCWRHDRDHRKEWFSLRDRAAGATIPTGAVATGDRAGAPARFRSRRCARAPIYSKKRTAASGATFPFHIPGNAIDRRGIKNAPACRTAAKSTGSSRRGVPRGFRAPQVRR